MCARVVQGLRAACWLAALASLSHAFSAPAVAQGFDPSQAVVAVGFAPDRIRPGEPSTLSVTIRNRPAGSLFVSGQLGLGALSVTGPNAGAVTGFANCNTDGDPSVVAGANGLALNVPFLLLTDGQECTLSFTVTSDAAGEYFVPAGPAVFATSFYSSQEPLNFNVLGATLEVASGPQLSLSALSVDFPPTPVGARSADRVVVATNIGSEGLTITAISASGDFRYASDCVNRTLLEQESCSIAVAFQPLRPAVRLGALALSTDDPGQPQAPIALAGVGLGAPLLVEVSPARLDFPPTADGQGSAPLPVTLTNVSSQPVAVGEARFDVGGFVAGDECRRTLLPNESCRLSVRFFPQRTGPTEALLRFETSPADAAGVALASGTGLPAPARLRLLPAQARFLEQLVGTVSEELAFQLVNEGNRPATVTGVSVTGDFRVTASSACAELAAGASCVIGARFAPTATGERQGTLSVAALRAEGPIESQLSGLAQLVPTPRLALSATAVGFGNVLVGSAAQGVATLTNLGTGPLTIKSLSAPTPFRVAAGTCPQVLPSRGSCQVGLFFEPLLRGAFSGAAAIDTDTPAGPAGLSLSGTGCSLVISARGADIGC